MDWQPIETAPKGESYILVGWAGKPLRALAKRRGKAVPSHGELELMASAALRCADCTRPMNWLSKDGQATVASLQHYRDGTMALVCRSCNTRHAFSPGDEFRDAPKDHKFCPHCQTFKPFIEFASDRSRNGEMNLKSWCATCSHAAITEWRKKNRDHYNAKQREGRARRRAARG